MWQQEQQVAGDAVDLANNHERLCSVSCDRRSLPCHCVLLVVLAPQGWWQGEPSGRHSYTPLLPLEAIPPDSAARHQLPPVLLFACRSALTLS